MRTSTLVFVCSLFATAVAAAATTSECGGDTVCAAAQDSSALLQSTVQVHDATQDSSALTQSALHDDASAKDGCEGKNETDCKAATNGETLYRHAWNNVEVKVPAGLNKSCVWSFVAKTGSMGCKKSCTHFPKDNKTACPKDYCWWVPSNIGNCGNGWSDGAEVTCGHPCLNTFHSVYTGGNTPQTGTTRMTQPGYKATENFDNSTSTWAGCGSNGDTEEELAKAENCWVGGTYQQGYTDAPENMIDRLTLPKGGKYSKARLDIGIDCKYDGFVEILLPEQERKYHQSERAHGWQNWADKQKSPATGDSKFRWSNMSLKLTYNLKKISKETCCKGAKKFNQEGAPWRTDPNCYCSYWKKYSYLGGQTQYVIKTNSADEFPVVRVEGSRLDSAKDALASVQVIVKDVPAGFDKCMMAKAKHADCLGEFDGISPALRSNHTSQMECLKSGPCACETDPGADCANVCCSWRKCLPEDSKLAILKLNEAMSLPGNATHPPNYTLAQVRSNLSQAACFNPDSADPEFWECECLDEIKAKRALAIRVALCAAPHICDSWKDARCPSQAPLLIQTQMSDRSEIAAVADGASLDESLAGKRCR